MTPPDGDWSYRGVTEEFLALETELDLFEHEIDGVPFWERVRFEVHKRTLRRLGILGDDFPGRSLPPTHERVADHVRSVTTRNPLGPADVPVVAFGHPRRKQLDDGLQWDIHCDPVLERLSSAAVSMENPQGHGHMKPARTPRLRYLDAIETAASLRRRLSRSSPLDAGDRALVNRVRAAIRSRFGVDVDVERLVETVLASRRTRLPLYERLLRRLDPEVVVLTVSYGAGRETQIEACQRLGVPVVELQHGVVDRHHFGYSYPGDRTKRSFPDHLLVFGEFWRDTVEYPIPDERVHPVGYPFLELQREKYEERGGDDERLVCVSQGTIGAELSEFAVELAERPAFEPEVVYKLHPAEADGWRDTYPWLAAAAADGSLRVVDDDDVSLYELFAGSTAQVGVYSTAVYEGLCFGLRTYVVDLPGSVRLEPLYDDGGATLVHSVDELVAAEADAAGTVAPDRERFFAPDALESVPATIDALVRGPDN